MMQSLPAHDMTHLRSLPAQARLSRRGRTLGKGRPALFALLLLAVSDTALAQKDDAVGTSSGESTVGTTSAAFLEIGVGARPQALGGAFVSMADDALGMYWNPAGIGRATGFEAAFTHVSWLVDTDFDFAGIVIPIGRPMALGFSVVSFSTGEQPVRVVGQEEGTGEFYSSQDLAAMVSFALNLTDRFSFGANGKYINQRVWNSSAAAIALDVGTLYDTQLDGLRIGFSVSNFGSDMSLSGRDLRNVLDPDALNEGVDNIPVSYETDSFALPLLFRFGLSYRRPVIVDQGNVTISVDLLHPNNDAESVNLGAEYVMFDAFALRAGYRAPFSSDHTNGLSLGGGVALSTTPDVKIALDYAYVDWGVLNAVHNFSVGLKL